MMKLSLCYPLSFLCRPLSFLCRLLSSLCHTLSSLCNPHSSICQPLSFPCHPLSFPCHPREGGEPSLPQHKTTSKMDSRLRGNDRKGDGKDRKGDGNDRKEGENKKEDDKNDRESGYKEKSKNNKRFLSNLILSFLLTSCTVGPHYLPPTVEKMPLGWQEHTKETKPFNGQAWWKHFHDPILTKLIEQQSTDNFNLRIAKARLEAAREEVAIATGQLFPKIGVDLLPPNATGTGIAQLLALSASIEADLFGRMRETRKRAKAIEEAEATGVGATLLQIQTEIATSYLEFREIQEKNRILTNSLTQSKTLLTLSQQNYQKGVSDYLSLASQKGSLTDLEAEIAQGRAEESFLLHRLELLTGNLPNQLKKTLSPYKKVPEMHQAIHLGIPSQLLMRRPDIIIAERQVAAAHANIKVALAELFPKITVGWLLGWQTETIASNLFALQNSTTAFFGLLNAPIFNLPAHGVVALRKREKLIAVLQYQMTVLQAFHEVQTQYEAYTYYEKSLHLLNKSLKQKLLAVKLAENNYKKGATNFQSVVTSEEAFNHAKLAYTHQLVRTQMARVLLYKALGGDVIIREQTPCPIKRTRKP